MAKRCFNDKKQPAEFRIVGQVRLRQFMLTVAGVRLDEGLPCLGAECMEAARKRPSDLAQMLIVKCQIIAAQALPQATNAPFRLPEWEKSVEYDTIDTVVAPVEPPVSWPPGRSASCGRSFGHAMVVTVCSLATDRTTPSRVEGCVFISASQ